MKKKIAVVLSGCGFKDGAEITESVSTLIALDQRGAQTTCFAPNITAETVDHRNDLSCGQRNSLVESSRITRGLISPLDSLDPKDFDGIVFPGGFGVALHLCDWASKGADSTVLKKVSEIILGFHSAKKGIAAICIAPVLLAKILGAREVLVTIGNDPETIQELEKTGAKHQECTADSWVIDEKNHVVTTPAYMLEAGPAQIFKGISGAIDALLKWQ